ncbi:MAG: hemolysin family protein [Parasphingorhabdus sp.]|nr:hemolysin family protein [Parasphingorhabdus sp.]
MTAFPWFDVAIIVVLILINGVFAMSELAIVSARSAKLQSAANDGSTGARIALRLASDPGKFLSSVQIGITLIGIVAGAYSGASLGQPVADRLAWLGFPEKFAGWTGFALVIGLTTYASLVVGELVPKQIALRSAEIIAIRVAGPMDMVARIAAPLVWLLDTTSAIILRLLGVTRDSQQHVTAEELHMIFAEATRSGVIEEHEREVIAGVVRMADRPVREVMTPRTEVDWVDVAASAEDVRQAILESPHSRLLIADGSVDEILGVLPVRDLFAAHFAGEAMDLHKLMRPLAKVPDQVDAMDALKTLREAEQPMVLVHDEYGHFEGIVTPADLMSSIAGEFASDRDEQSERSLIERSDGSLLVSGSLPIDTLAMRLDIKLPETRDYATVAGHALAQLRHLPDEGESFIDQGWEFEIVDMDGRKIDKLFVRRAEPVS